MESFAEGLWEYYPKRQRFILKGALSQRFGFAVNEVPMARLLENIPVEDRQTFTQFLEEARAVQAWRRKWSSGSGTCMES